MSKFSEICAKLAEIEQGRFQLLCIDYLYHNVKGFIHSPGTVRGKEKTKKGRPDIYSVLEDGKYLFAECTTLDDSDKKKFSKKLHKDLDDSLNSNEIKVSIQNISTIYLFCTSSVEINLIQELTAKGNNAGVKVHVVGLIDLALYYANIGRVFAQDFLQVQFLTGQVLTKDEFVAQYRRRNIATPLDNPLIGREKELTILTETLKKEDLIILSGNAGVGKSRLAIAALESFHEQNSDYIPYYIFQKSGEITIDLATFLKPGKNYILLVDDANRQQQNLLSVLNKYIECDFKVKIIMTVRDYARQEVIDLCSSFKPAKFKLNRIPSETIGEIIRAEPFSLQSHQIEQRIIEVSNGNPRLAIMAANIMRENPEIKLLKDVTNIYDEYFESVLKENNIFKDKLTLQVLGIIGFFYTIDTQEIFDCDVLKAFDLSKEQFMERAAELEELEVIDLHQNSVVKISDQILSTYFFFNAFLRNHSLSLSTLLEKYHSSHQHRYRETFLACIETFGPEKTISENNTEWLKFWECIKDNREEAVYFMQIFGIYFPDQLFSLFNRYIKETEQKEKTPYLYSEYRNAPSQSDKDPLLNLLEPYFTGHGAHFETAVFLAFEYVRKQRTSITALIDLLKKCLYLNTPEINSGFKRILFVYNFLKKNFDIDELYPTTFYHLMDKVILSSAGRKELYHKVGERHALLESIANLRNQFLLDFNENFIKYRKTIFPLLLDYVKEKRELLYPELVSDQKLMIQIFNDYLTNKEFGDCYLVQIYHNLLQKTGIEISGELVSLKKKFLTTLYRQYKTLQIYDRDSDGHIDDHETHFYKKKKIIEKKWPILDVPAFEKFYKNCRLIQKFLPHSSNIADGISVVIESVFEKNIDSGFAVLKYYLEQGNQFLLNGVRIYRPLYNSTAKRCLELYKLLDSITFELEDRWKQNFFDHLPEEHIDKNTTSLLLAFFKQTKSKVDIYLSSLDKYEKAFPDTIAKILHNLSAKRKADKEYIYKLEYTFFKDAPFILQQDFDLCKTLYFQQEEMPEQYDPDGKELFTLVSHERKFFAEYMNFLLDTKRRSFINANKQLQRVWLQPNPEELIELGLIMIEKVPALSRRDHVGCIFFYGSNPEQNARGFKVIQKLIAEYSTNESMINFLFDTVRNSMPDYFKPAIQELLTYNQNIAFFEQIELHNNHFSYSGNEIWAEKKARDLLNIAGYIRELPNHYAFLEHQESLQKQIRWEDEDTKREKKYQFRGFR